MAKDPNSDWLVGLFIGFGFGAAGVASALAWVTSSIGAASIPIWAITAWGAMRIFRGPFGKALSARLAGQATDQQPEVPHEVYVELDELRARAAELEERMDFSERLLTRDHHTELRADATRAMEARPDSPLPEMEPGR